MVKKSMSGGKYNLDSRETVMLIGLVTSWNK